MAKPTTSTKMLADQPRTAVLGLGLIGASAAAALTQAGWQVTGFDQDRATAQRALDAGWVEAMAVDSAACVHEAEFVLLAQPVSAILGELPRLAEVAADGAVVMDMGSTKGQVCSAMSELPDRLAAIGGHPMTGRVTKEVPGVTAELFSGCTFALCATERTTEQAQRMALQVLDVFGAQPLMIDAVKHDEVVAMISHVPHFLAVALMQATAAQAEPQTWALAAGGFKQIARRAADNPAMWRDIAVSNGPAIAAALREFAAQTARLADLMDGSDPAALEEALDHARARYLDQFGV